MENIRVLTSLGPDSRNYQTAPIEKPEPHQIKNVFFLEILNLDNELSPNRDCKWAPRFASSCAGTASTPEKYTCNQFMDIGRSSTTSKGIPIRSYNSSSENPINVLCTYQKFYLGNWWRTYMEPPDSNKTQSAYQKSSQRVIFPGLKGNNFPFDQDDAYWIDMSFLAIDEKGSH